MKQNQRRKAYFHLIVSRVVVNGIRFKLIFFVRSIFSASVVAGNGKDSFSSVPLPAPLPMANSNSQCAMRLFIVCVPKVIQHFSHLFLQHI